MTHVPRYPVYIPSKARADVAAAPRMFNRDGVPYRLVVEPQDADSYREKFGRDRVLVLPENDRGLVFARNWIKDHAIAAGAVRHWQFDDDVAYMRRLHKGYRLNCTSDIALAAAEDFADQYENVGLLSFNSMYFAHSTAHGSTMQKWPPFYVNQRCYTNFLMLNTLPNRWRGRYNEDTDMTLQVLAAGWCTVLFNVFLIWCPTTMTQTGGQTDIYVGEGRLRMARELARRWPGVVEVRKRYSRAQHHIKFNWGKFTTPLKRRADAPPVGAYDMTLKAVGDVESSALRKLVDEGA